MRSSAGASRRVDGRHRLRDHDEWRPASEHAAGIAPAAGATRAAARGRPHHSTRSPPLRRRPGMPGAPTPRRWSPSIRVQWRAAPAAPRGSTPWASAPRSRNACKRSPVAAVRMDDHAARRAGHQVSRHGPGQRAQLPRRDEPGRTVHRSVLRGEPAPPASRRAPTGTGRPRRRDPSPLRDRSCHLPAPARFGPFSGAVGPVVPSAGHRHGSAPRRRRGPRRPGGRGHSDRPGA